MSTTTGKTRAFDESWFERPLAERMSDPPTSSPPQPSRIEGSKGWAMILGALGGAGGGIAMLFVAREIARRTGSTVDIIGTIGHGARRFTDEHTGGLAIAIVLGAILGIGIGALFRHSLRIVPRVLAGALLASVLWTLVQAFLLVGALGSLPFGAMVAGAAVYGVCVAIIPPPKRRYVLPDSG